MTPLYPLRFEPIFRRYIWGGRRLESVLEKALGAGDDYAESWEICDREEDQSVVQFGPLTGRSLGELVRDYPEELFGSSPRPPRFPLLFKFLDAQKQLSVQVHPNDAQAARLDPPDLGKTEAWYVIAAEPGSKIFAGLKRGFDRAALEREVHRGTSELCLHVVEPRPGDCFFIPAGTVHALGAGLVIAEIQQASDTTYRLFDWNRVGPDGQPRPLHVEQALDVIDYERGPVDPIKAIPTADGRRQLVACDKFVWNEATLDRPNTIGGDGRFHFLAVIEGGLLVEGDPAGQPVRKGQTVLIPGGIGAIGLNPLGRSVFLDAWLP